VTDTPLILDVKGNSLDDGPGIRTVVFFKGCPLSCVWCHNPEARAREAELGFERSDCVGARACFDVCEAGALSKDLPDLIDRARCDLCFDCVDVCAAGALDVVGRPMSVERILAAVAKDRPFFEASGGGITLSGGEPTLFMRFAAELAGGAQALGIHVLLETCGAFDLGRFEAELAPRVDLVYFDLKLHDRDEHRRLCGADNATILRNFAALWRCQQVEVLPRIPLVPGMTATDSNLRTLAGFLRGLGVDRVALLAYNPLWGDKLAKLGLPGEPAAEDPALRQFMDDADLDRCRSWFSGITLV